MELSVRERSRVSRVLNGWKLLIENPRHNLQQTGVYQIKRDSNAGESIQIFHHSYSRSTDYYDELWFLTAVDEDKRPLGMRRINVQDEETSLAASGNIEVFKRGRGIAGKLEALNMHKLQQVINSLQGYTSLEYEIWDISERRISHLQSDMSTIENSDELNELELDLSQKIRERQAWLKLYGEGGRLGFQYDHGRRELVKTYIPGQSDKVQGYTIEEMQGELDLKDAIDATLRELK